MFNHEPENYVCPFCLIIEGVENDVVWTKHLHVFPRYEGDDLYKMNWRSTTPAERLPYASRLKAYFSDPNCA